MVDILKNEDGRQIVKLSENYAYGTHMTTAALAENVVLIDVLRPRKKSKQYVLTADEMNALTDAWTQFKHTQEVAKELEQKRIAELKTDSYTIAWIGSVPPNTTFSSGMESRYNLIAGDGGDVSA